MPKLLQINLCVNALSTGKIVEQIGHLALKHGYDSYIAYGMECYSDGVPTSKLSLSKTIKIGSKLTRLCHRLLSRVFHQDGCGSYFATQKFIKQVDSISPDIIHLHNIYNSYINHKLLFNYLASRQTPVIYTLHDCRAFTGYCSHFVYVNCERWKYQCGKCPYLCHTLFRDYSKSNFDSKKILYDKVNFKCIVGVSQWLSDCINMSYLFSSYNTRTIFNGIDCDVFKPSNIFDKDNSKFVILGVAGAWNNRKGLSDYVRLSQILDLTKYKIVLVGLSNKQINALPSTIQGYPLTNSDKELSMLYNQADLLLSLSQGETFGLTLAEALACGTPILAYENTAQSEIADFNVGGTVKTGDLNSIVEMIIKISENGKAFYSYSCRKKAVRFYDKNLNYTNYLNIYNKIINAE